MKDTSDAMSAIGALIYAALIIGIVFFIIFGIEQFANVLLPLLTESIEAF